jgi:tRNA A37 threonylcarbamoyladenosine synthetase subunit TsaC/SUA5/YrdC
VDEIRNNLGHLIDYIIDCGPAPQGTPSTVVDVTDGAPKLLREGAIPFAEVVRVIGQNNGFSGHFQDQSAPPYEGGDRGGN